MSTLLDAPARPTSTDRLLAALLAGAAALAIAGFTALGSIFEYPQILQEPTAQILDLYRENRTGVSAWFAVLCLGAALLAPVGLLLARSAGGQLGRAIAVTGVAAAAVQVVGLSRWVLLVPGIAADAAEPTLAAEAHDRFETLHFWLGTVVGESVGYVLTATFTVLVATALSRRRFPALLVRLGYASAALIVTGVLVPFGVHAAALTNFAGYVGWCLWLLALAAVLLRRSAGDESGVPRPS